MDFSTAAGTKKSHFFSMNSLGFFVLISPPLKPSNVPFSMKCFLAASVSIPFALYTAELYSTMATILAPSSTKNLEAQYPTFPYP